MAFVEISQSRRRNRLKLVRASAMGSVLLEVVGELEHAKSRTGKLQLAKRPRTVRHCHFSYLKNCCFRLERT